MSEIVPNLRYFYQVLNGATYKVFGYPHWGTNKWRHKYDSYNLNHGIKFSDGKLAGYLKISIIFSLTERLRSFLQNRRFLREFHYGLGILKTENSRKRSMDPMRRTAQNYQSRDSRKMTRAELPLEFSKLLALVLSINCPDHGSLNRKIQKIIRSVDPWW